MRDLRFDADQWFVNVRRNDGRIEPIVFHIDRPEATVSGPADLAIARDHCAKIRRLRALYSEGIAG